MNLFEILKQFKNIEPDPAFKEKSKRAVLATTPRESWSAQQMIVRILEAGVAVALSAFFILFITGQLPNVPYISPVQFSVINPETLHAEAQAVDIQIQLAKIAYQESTTTPESTIPAIMSATAGQPTTATVPNNSSTAAASAQTASSTPTSTVSIDQALKALSN